MANPIKHTILWKFFHRTGGSSLAELAVVAAIMATLTATASPKLAAISRDGKVKKSLDEIEKIIKMGQNFYQETADTEGRGRFPGQEKYTMPVPMGGYEMNHELFIEYQSIHAETIIIMKEEIYESVENIWYYTHDDLASWASVFGTNYSWYTGGNIQDDEYNACGTCKDTDPGWETEGHEEWLKLFNGEVLHSPYTDGHYIFVVIPGGETGEKTFPPTLIVADRENPSFLHMVLIP